MMDMTIQWDKNRVVAKNIFELIGRTPLLELTNITKGIKPKILAKIEYFSPTGSLKDRIYYEMIIQAEEAGILKPGMTIIETSTGNAGIACTFIGGLRGYPVSIVMPKGMSEERKKLIRAYGGSIIETPGGESDVDLSLQKTKEIMAQDPDRYWQPSQFGNPNNITAHYTTTSPEIWEQTEGQVEAFVASQGTGGTLTGIGRFLREKNPEVSLFAVEPSEAPILAKREWGSHKIEGIGDGFVPVNLDLSILTGIVTTTSQEALDMARRLALKEGLFCGISSGCNVAACLKVAKRFPNIKAIVTMINDTGQRYFTTELCGEAKHVDIPDRDHPLDDYTIQQLDKYQHNWVILE
jgi:cysteine synthase A